jgi:hypothetical protein
LQTQRELIAKFLRAVYIAKNVMNTNDAKLIETALKTVPGSTPAFLKADYELFRVFQCDPVQRGKSVAYMSPKLWDDTVKLYRSIGVVEHPLDPHSLYTNEFAEGPHAVTTNKCGR